MNIIIREANLDDSKIANKFLTKLIVDEKKYNSNINEKCVVKEFYEHFISREGYIMLIAEVDNKIVGYLYGFIENTGDTYINKISKLEALYVEVKYRKHGIAKKLVEEFKKWSIKNEVKCIEVQVCSKNEEAFNLYTKNGYKDIKTTLYNDISKEK